MQTSRGKQRFNKKGTTMFTIAQQEKKLEQVQPKLWGWRYLFNVLISIQHNQIEANKLAKEQNKLLATQVRLLRGLQPHQITDEDIAFIKEMSEATHDQ